MNEIERTQSDIGAIEMHERIAHELMAYTAERSDVVLSQATIEATLERYENDSLGAAVALDITHTMAAELALDGTLDDEETDPIDELVSILKTSGLAGTPIDQITSYLQIDLSLGALHGIATLCDMLSDASLGYLDELLTVFNKEDVSRQEDRDNAIEADLAFYEADDTDEVILAEPNKPHQPPTKRLEITSPDGDIFDIG